MGEHAVSMVPGISGRKVRERPCIMCGGPRDIVVAYTTNQGKRSKRWNPRCRACSAAKRKAAHEANKEESLQKSRDWKDANRDRIAAYNRERQQDPEVRALKAYHQRLRKARTRSGQGDDAAVRAVYLYAKEVERVVARCPLFAIPELGYEMQVDHIMPLSRGGPHVADNLQVLPKGLNMRKGVRCPK